MLLMRKFEEKVAQLFSEGMIHGTMHLYVGEEAVAAGVCTALGDHDVITSTHRGHGHSIAKGAGLTGLMAEMLGREAGCCKGRGGSMHFADFAGGNLGGNGIVGGSQSIAVGAALAAKMKKTGGIAVCFFGDGAANEGSFHEAANMASVLKLPVLFVCENNLYGMSMPLSRSMNISDIAVRASAYGFPGRTVDGNDATAVYRAAEDARDYVKQNGPMLLVCNTYRISGHSKSDTNVYRTQREIDAWQAKDPVLRMAAFMLKNGFSQAALDEADETAARDIESAVAAALQSPYPDARTVLDGVYA